jgi:hypothetical protein
MQNDIANNSTWQKTDRQKICDILGISDSELNLEYYDYYCTTAEECDKYTIVALYNESDGNLAVINKDLTIKY